MAYWAFQIFFNEQRALILAVLAGGLLVIVFFAVPATAIVIAIFSPVSVGIAVLALGDLLRSMTFRFRSWTASELAILLLTCLVFLYASMGGVRFDPYSLGYSGFGPVFITLSVALYAWFRFDFLLAVAVILAQAAWLTGIGSDNIFDHLFSVLLIPACIVGLSRRYLESRPGKPTPRGPE